ncbi:hypothetical protein HDU83_000275 [Entophlyctis luteolus]|nr:hypothetical protein HDU83_000275 [Entophlyctis luteolus]KAJ3378838.1 hypothetical protein HDU84_007249 [Entophlyctis sp. JEL0112]
MQPDKQAGSTNSSDDFAGWVGDAGPAVVRLSKQLARDNSIVLASASSAIVSVVAGYPFDLIKTRMQAFRYPSSLACIREIYTLDGEFDSACFCQLIATTATGGMTGFFRGMGPILLTVSVLRSVSFSVYSSAKPILISHFDNLRFPAIHPSLPSLPEQLRATVGGLKSSAESLLSPELAYRWTNLQTPSPSYLFACMLSGAIAGSVVATLNAPLEFIKIQRQLDAKMRASTTTVTSRTLENIVESSAGAVASGTAGGLGEGAAAAAASGPYRTAPTSAEPKRFSSTASATISPAAAAKQHMGAWEWAKKIVRQKGMLGLYSGYSFHLARDFIGTGLYFGGYETLKLVFTPKGETAGSMVHMLAGGVSGTLSWIVLFPIDLVSLF